MTALLPSRAKRGTHSPAAHPPGLFDSLSTRTMTHRLTKSLSAAEGAEVEESAIAMLCAAARTLAYLLETAPAPRSPLTVAQRVVALAGEYGVSPLTLADNLANAAIDIGALLDEAADEIDAAADAGQANG